MEHARALLPPVSNLHAAALPAVVPLLWVQAFALSPKRVLLVWPRLLGNPEHRLPWAVAKEVLLLVEGLLPCLLRFVALIADLLLPVRRAVLVE